LDEFTGAVVLVTHDLSLLRTLCEPSEDPTEDERHKELWIADRGTVKRFDARVDHVSARPPFVCAAAAAAPTWRRRSTYKTRFERWTLRTTLMSRLKMTANSNDNKGAAVWKLFGYLVGPPTRRGDAPAINYR
jgi:hypothetical protein